jgi:hypothetical protein
MPPIDRPAIALFPVGNGAVRSIDHRYQIMDDDVFERAEGRFDLRAEPPNEFHRRRSHLMAYPRSMTTIIGNACLCDQIIEDN